MPNKVLLCLTIIGHIRELELLTVSHVAELRGFVEMKISELVPRPDADLHLSCEEEGGDLGRKVEDYEKEEQASRRGERVEPVPEIDLEGDKVNNLERRGTKTNAHGSMVVEIEDTTDIRDGEREVGVERKNMSLGSFIFESNMSRPTKPATTIIATTTTTDSNTQKIGMEKTEAKKTAEIMRQMAMANINMEHLNEGTEETGDFITKIPQEINSTTNFSKDMMANEKNTESKRSISPTSSRLITNSASPEKQIQNMTKTCFVLFACLLFNVKSDY